MNKQFYKDLWESIERIDVVQRGVVLIFLALFLFFAVVSPGFRDTLAVIAIIGSVFIGIALTFIGAVATCLTVGDMIENYKTIKEEREVDQG